MIEWKLGLLRRRKDDEEVQKQGKESRKRARKRTKEKKKTKEKLEKKRKIQRMKRDNDTNSREQS